VTARRYGWGHQQARARIARIVAAGEAVCARCGRPIDPDAAWDLDHQRVAAGATTWALRINIAIGAPALEPRTCAGHARMASSHLRSPSHAGAAAGADPVDETHDAPTKAPTRRRGGEAS
jgi:hypothetical protein